MRPDRIVVGEVRGAEVLEMLQAMNTGHDGSMATIHANSPRDCLYRIEMLAGLPASRAARTACAGRSPAPSTSSCRSRGWAAAAARAGLDHRDHRCQRQPDHHPGDVPPRTADRRQRQETDRWIGLGFHPHSRKLEPFRQQLRESLYGDF
jgi:pilus assembly protein CpaF